MKVPKLTYVKCENVLLVIYIDECNEVQHRCLLYKSSKMCQKRLVKFGNLPDCTYFLICISPLQLINQRLAEKSKGSHAISGGL